MAISLTKLIIDGLDLIKGEAIDNFRMGVSGEGQVRQFEMTIKARVSSIYWQIIDALKHDGWIKPCSCLETMIEFERNVKRDQISEKSHKDQFNELDQLRINCKKCFGTGYLNLITIERTPKQKQESNVIELVKDVDGEDHE